MLGEYQRGPGEPGGMMGTDRKGSSGGFGDDSEDGQARGDGVEVDSREYGWDQADVKEMQKQYENFLKASKANKWWKRGDE